MRRLLPLCLLAPLLVTPVPPPGSGLPGPLLDIPYGAYHPDLRFDWYAPANSTGSDPAVVFLHGGATPFGDKGDVVDEYPELLELLRLNGIGVAAVEFRPYPAYHFPSQLEDVKLSLQFLRANAAIWSIDPARIGVWGHSSGALLGGLAAYGEDAADPLGDAVTQQSSRPVLWLDMFGITDFDLLVPWFTGDMFGEVFLGQVDPGVLDEASVTWLIENVPRPFTPPVCTLYGQTINPPPFENPHDAWFALALRQALRRWEPEANALSWYEIRDEALAEITASQLVWTMERFGMPGPAVQPGKK